MTPRLSILAGLAAVALSGCSPLGGDAERAGLRVKQQYETELSESAAEERPERPADFVPRPVVGRPEAMPLQVEPVLGVELTLNQSVEYMLPGWETKVVFAHGEDQYPPVGEPRRVRFPGGSLGQFLQALSDTWDVDVFSPHVGVVHVASRRLEPWLVTHLMQPPAAPGGGSAYGGSNQAGNRPQTQQQQNSAAGGGVAVGSVAAELVAEAGEGLETLMRRLRELSAGGNEDNERSVWLNAEAGLLYVWAPPSARRAMRPLLLQYGARPLAADPELLTMMTRGQFRLRLVLVRLASTNDRNVGLQWEESLEAIFPAGRSVLGVPDVGYDGYAREGRLLGAGDFMLGTNGLQLGGEVTHDRNAVTFPFGTRWELASERSRQDAMRQVIGLEKERTEADFLRVNSRIGELEEKRRVSIDSGPGNTFSSAEARELNALQLEREKIRTAIEDLTKEAGLAALRSAQADQWLARVTEGAERDMRRSLSLLASLGSSHGQTQIAHTVSIDARHGRPLPLRVGSERTYLASISETVSQSFSTTAATPQTRLEGLDLVMRPWLEGRQCVRVGLALTSSGVTSVASFAVAGTELAIPQMAVQTWVSERRLCDSRPALIGRFKLESSMHSRTGVPFFGERQVPLNSDVRGNAEEYLLLLQVLLPPEWEWR